MNNTFKNNLVEMTNKETQIFEKFRRMLRHISRLPEDFWKDWKKKANIVNIRKGVSLVEYGEINRKTYFIASGSFRTAILTSEGALKTVSLHFSELFPYIQQIESLHKPVPSAYEITAMADSVVIELNHSHFEVLNKKYPNFSVFNQKCFVRDLTEMNRIRVQLVNYSSEEFITFLMKNYPIIVNETPNRYLAEFMGISATWYSKLKHKTLNKGVS